MHLLIWFHGILSASSDVVGPSYTWRSSLDKSICGIGTDRYAVHPEACWGKTGFCLHCMKWHPDSCDYRLSSSGSLGKNTSKAMKSHGKLSILKLKNSNFFCCFCSFSKYTVFVHLQWPGIRSQALLPSINVIFKYRFWVLAFLFYLHPFYYKL